MHADGSMSTPMLALLVCLTTVTRGQDMTSCQGHPDGCSTAGDSGTTKSQSLLQRKSNVLNKITGVENDPEATSQAGAVKADPPPAAGVKDATSEDADAAKTTAPAAAVKDVPSEGAGAEDTTKAAGTEDTTKAAGSEDTAKAAGTEDTTKAAGTQDTTKAAGTEDTTKAAGTEDTTKAAGTKDTTKAAGTKDTAEAEGTEDTTKAAGTEDTTKAAGAEDTTKAAGTEDTAEAEGTGIFENDDDDDDEKADEADEKEGEEEQDDDKEDDDIFDEEKAVAEPEGAEESVKQKKTAVEDAEAKGSDGDEDDEGEKQEAGNGNGDPVPGVVDDHTAAAGAVDDAAQQFQEDVKKDAEKFVKAVTENKAGGGDKEVHEEPPPPTGKPAPATEATMNHLCFDEGKSFANAKAAAKYFQNECLHVYEYNETLCDGLSDKVFEKWHEDMSAAWKPDSDVCDEVDSLLRADSARRHEMGLATVVASLPTPPPTASSMLERAKRSSSASTSSTMDEAMRYKPISPAPPPAYPVR